MRARPFFLVAPLPLSLLLLLPVALSQTPNTTISGLSLCWQDCIQSSGGSSCSDSSADSYVSCLCDLADQTVLDSAITCVQSTCASELDSSLPVVFLQDACSLVGAPIPSSAVAAAESAESSAAVASVGSVGSAPSSGIGYITTSDGGLVGIIPVTVGGGNTMSGIPGGGSSDGGRATPVPLGGGPIGASAAASSSAMASAAASSRVMASSSASSQAVVVVGQTTSTSTTMSGTTSSGFSSRTSGTATTSSSNSAGADTSSTADTGSAIKTEGAPLGMQGAGSRKDASSLLGLTIWLIAGIVWF